MKDIRSRQLFLMRMESDGNGGGRASHSAVWGDRKWEDHSIATTPSQMAPGRSVPLSTVSVCVWCSGGGMIVVTEPRGVAAVVCPREWPMKWYSLRSIVHIQHKRL